MMPDAAKQAGASHKRSRRRARHPAAGRYAFGRSWSRFIDFDNYVSYGPRKGLW